MSENTLVGKRVIVVEDEGITLMQLHKIFRHENIELIGTASNGPDGVALTLREKPDMVLMDINMPGDYNGLEAARRILAAFPTCILMMTAYSDCMEEAQESGAYGYLLKPLDRESLLLQMERAHKRFVAGELPDIEIEVE